MRADYVIIGAGSAGCVLANRLSEDPGAKVVLIEAGGRDWNPYIHVPAGFMKMLDHPTLTWGYHAEPDPGTAGRAILYPRGRVLGGSSSINGLIYIRGQPEDFDHWAQLGNRGWGWDEVLPFFKKAENWEGERERSARQGRPAVYLQDGPVAALRGGHRGRQGDRPRIPRGRQRLAGRRRRQHRLVPADPRRPPAGQHRPHLSAAGAEAAQPAGHRQGAGQPHRLRRPPRRRGRIRARRDGRARRCRARSDPLRRRRQLAAHPAAFRGRRARASEPRRHPGPSRAAGGRAATCRTTTSRGSAIRSAARSPSTSARAAWRWPARSCAISSPAKAC